MGKTFDAIDERLEAFLRDQRLFFVATAPLDADGHLNCSPKGLDTFAVLDPHTVAYLDLTGSGVETIAHLRENGRIVLTFSAFEGPPKIVRLARARRRGGARRRALRRPARPLPRPSRRRAERHPDRRGAHLRLVRLRRASL